MSDHPGQLTHHRASHSSQKTNLGGDLAAGCIAHDSWPMGMKQLGMKQ